MDENLKGINKKKCLSQLEMPVPLLRLCFQMMRKYEVAKVVFAPFRLEKTDSAVKTDNANDSDDTLGAFSFDDPMDTHSLLGLLAGYPSRTSSPVVEIDETTPASSDAVIVHHPVGLKELFRQVELHMLCSRGFVINPLLDEILFHMNNPEMCLFNTFCLRSLTELKAIDEVVASLCDTRISVIQGTFPALTDLPADPKPSIDDSVNSCLDSSIPKTDDESDNSLVEVYYRLPTALNETAKDICYLDQNNKFMNLRFDMDSITRAQVSDLKVDINFNVKKRKLDERVNRPWKRRCTANEN